jgi:hypothetical protein
MSEQGMLFSGDGSRGISISRGPLQRATRVLWSGPSAEADGSRFRSVLLRIAAVLVAVGLVTVSWDRLLNVQAGPYNVKLPALVLSVAAVLALLGTRRAVPVLVGRGARRVVAGLVAAIVLYELVRGLFSASPTAAFAQVAALLSGAVLPAVAVLLVVRTKQHLRWALGWLLVGAVIAAVFGLYQLFAFYTGLPQGIQYVGVGIGTGIGRISAFDYEPAYFAYYMLLVLGAFIALRRLDGGDVGWRPLIAFGAILYLANVRAVPLVAIGIAVLLVLALRWNRRLLVRGAAVLVVTVAVALATPTAVTTIAGLVPQAAPASDAGSPARDHSDPVVSDSPDAAESDAAVQKGIQSQLQSVDPGEKSSNAPRLGLYSAVLREVAHAPVFGLGAGNLGDALRSNAPSAIQDQIGGQVVANNIWLQALADGGAVQLLLELALVVTVLVAALRRRTAAVYPMAAGVLAVIGVGGMLTSYLFDIKVWVVLALALVGFALADAAAPARAEPKPVRG